MNGQEILSRELALRIGLAARALPDTDAKSLFMILAEAVGLPLTDAKLTDLDLYMLKTALDGQLAEVDEICLKRVLLLLKQPTGQLESNRPVPQAYTEGDLPGSVRIACASNDALQVDGHFGSCTHFYIYQVSATRSVLCDVRDTAPAEGLVVPDRNLYRAELIQDCQVLYVASVGGPAAAKIVKLGIHPMKLSDVQTMTSIIEQLQQVIAGMPPPWLAKAMGIEAPQRVRFAQEAGG